MAKCSCGCGGKNAAKSYSVSEEKDEMSLSDLPVGATATIVRILPKMRGRKKFADVGLIPGTELILEARAPFGGLIRVKVMETSMAIHEDDANGIILKAKETGK